MFRNSGNPSQGDLFAHFTRADMLEGLKRKAQGMKQVGDNSGFWFRLAMIVVTNYFKPGWRGLPEEFRPVVTRVIGPPHDFHVWGSLTTELTLRRLIRKTGNRRPMRDPRSKGRDTAEYERI